MNGSKQIKKFLKQWGTWLKNARPMQTITALQLLGGGTADAARWIGVVEEATRRWLRSGLMAPTRDRVIAATLRKAAADAQGISAEDWWSDEITHSRRLENVLLHHNAALVEFMREKLDKDPLEYAAEHIGRGAPATAAAA